MKGYFLVGIPNNGRLCDDVWNYLEDKLLVQRGNPRSLLHVSGELIYISARSSDLPYLLDAGFVDMIITGRDYVLEANVNAFEVADLQFQQCEIAILSSLTIKTPNRVLRVASQYPNLAKKFYSSRGVTIKFLEVSGAAEMFLRTGIVDEILDAVMTGSTANANQISIKEVIDHTSGRIYIRDKDSMTGEMARSIQDILHGRSLP
jgi:ATP phosphoribosyltransferase